MAAVAGSPDAEMPRTIPTMKPMIQLVITATGIATATTIPPTRAFPRPITAAMIATTSTARLTITFATQSRRSEEHTSELQSRGHLVCRLLLEKKKKKQNRLEKTNKKHERGSNTVKVRHRCQ